jgi:hypothetical protein
MNILKLQTLKVIQHWVLVRFGKLDKRRGLKNAMENAMCKWPIKELAYFWTGDMKMIEASLLFGNRFNALYIPFNHPSDKCGKFKYG